LCTDSLAGQGDLFSGYLKPLVNVQTLVETFGRTGKYITLEELLLTINPVVEFYRSVAKEVNSLKGLEAGVRVPSRVNYHCNFCQTVWPIPGAQFFNATLRVGTVKEIKSDEMTFEPGFVWSGILIDTVGLPSPFVGERFVETNNFGKLDFSESVPDFWKKQRKKAAREDATLQEHQTKEQTPLRFSHGWDALTDEEKDALKKEIKHYKEEYLKNKDVNSITDAFASVNISGNRNEILSTNWEMEVMNYLVYTQSYDNAKKTASLRIRRTMNDIHEQKEPEEPDLVPDESEEEPDSGGMSPESVVRMPFSLTPATFQLDHALETEREFFEDYTRRARLRTNTLTGTFGARGENRDVLYSFLDKNGQSALSHAFQT